MHAAIVILSMLVLPAAPSPSVRDKAILKAGVIVASDVPSGWDSTRQSDTSSKDFKGIAECKQVQAGFAAAKKSLPRALSRQFTDPSSGGTTFAEDVVYAFKNVNAANKFLTPFQATNAAVCLQKGFQRALGTSASVSPITDLQGVGDDNAGYELVAMVTNGGQSTTLYIDIMTIRIGRAVLGFEFLNQDQRIPQGPDIVNAAINRVAALTK